MTRFVKPMANDDILAPTPARRDPTFLVCGVLIAMILAVFWPVLNAQFVNYDDTDFVTTNPNVAGGLTGDNVAWAFTSTRVYWQPLTWLSYQLDAQLHGLKPRGFHLTNLLLHALNAVLPRWRPVPLSGLARIQDETRALFNRYFG